MRYLITFSYDGTKFHGFQRQKNMKNVQGMLENILSGYFGEEIVIKGAGRTDAGVHAYNQCAHFDVSRKIRIKDVLRLNKLLNKEIVIKDCKRVNDDFHARYNVKEKTYKYRINYGEYDSKKEGYYYQLKKDLNIKDMKEAAKIFVGAHDYKNFVSGDREDYTSIIYSIKVKNTRKIITIIFKGVGFYRYMVRHIVGAIMDVGKGSLTINDIKNMLDNPNIVKSSSVVPADGLYLVKIKY